MLQVSLGPFLGSHPLKERAPNSYSRHPGLELPNGDHMLSSTVLCSHLHSLSASLVSVIEQFGTRKRDIENTIRAF